ncbi:MAG: hypothetical protein Q7R34_15315, partial [Dehalococcoidia bacterium]|nr:hypothetical protein [Dehalococcoidia bacterium]
MGLGNGVRSLFGQKRKNTTVKSRRKRNTAPDIELIGAQVKASAIKEAMKDKANVKQIQSMGAQLLQQLINPNSDPMDLMMMEEANRDPEFKADLREAYLDKLRKEKGIKSRKGHDDEDYEYMDPFDTMMEHQTKMDILMKRLGRSSRDEGGASQYVELLGDILKRQDIPIGALIGSLLGGIAPKPNGQPFQPPQSQVVTVSTPQPDGMGGDAPGALQQGPISLEQNMYPAIETQPGGNVDVELARRFIGLFNPDLPAEDAAQQAWLRANEELSQASMFQRLAISVGIET